MREKDFRLEVEVKVYIMKMLCEDVQGCQEFEWPIIDHTRPWREGGLQPAETGVQVICDRVYLHLSPRNKGCLAAHCSCD